MRQPGAAAAAASASPTSFTGLMTPGTTAISESSGHPSARRAATDPCLAVAPGGDQLAGRVDAPPLARACRRRRPCGRSPRRRDERVGDTRAPDRGSSACVRGTTSCTVTTNGAPSSAPAGEVHARSSRGGSALARRRTRERRVGSRSASAQALQRDASRTLRYPTSGVADPETTRSSTLRAPAPRVATVALTERPRSARRASRARVGRRRSQRVVHERSDPVVLVEVVAERALLRRSPQTRVLPDEVVEALGLECRLLRHDHVANASSPHLLCRLPPVLTAGVVTPQEPVALLGVGELASSSHDLCRR